MAVAGVPTELGTEKISKLLRQYAVPAIIAMTASSLYNMVDSIFIGHGVGKFAIAGLALTFPLMNLGAAFGALVGVGASATISMLLGQKNYEMAQKVLGNVVTLNTIIGIVYSIVFLVFLDPILYFFGASENTLPYAKEYMTIILYGNIITHLYFGLNAAMRASGSPKKAMALTIFTVVFNTILDPIFIFVFDMGIAGAAWATVLAQTVAMIIVLHHFNNKQRAFHFEKGIVRLAPNIPGWVNIENAVGASAIGLVYGLDPQKIKEALATFSGVKRRFDLQVRRPDCVYIDDYAHHPEEISAALSSIRKAYPSMKLTAAFQPHLYTRTRDFAEEFAKALSNVDKLILLDIYPAREEPIPGVTSEIIFKDVTAPEKVLLKRSEFMEYMQNEEVELLVTLGAGDIDRFVGPIAQMLEDRR